MNSNFGRIGFILAVLGSSIGLGHIWRFPYIASVGGGGAFVLLFLLISIIGGAMLIGEMLIGNNGRTNVPDSFKVIANSNNTKWRFMGVSLFFGPIILTFYGVVLGWVLYYMFAISFNLPVNYEESKQVFITIISSDEKFIYQVLCFGFIAFVTAYGVANGIKRIEKLNFILLPLLFIIFIGLLVYAFFLPSFSKAFSFMFKVDFSKINQEVLMIAMGQVFFSLSIGAGSIITYAAHSKKEQNLFSSALWVIISGVIISIIAGLVIFTFIFEYNPKSTLEGGAGIVFIALSLAFSKFGLLGSLFCVIFMMGLLFAGISSTVSMLEPCVKYLENKTKFSRNMISYGVMFCIFLVGVIMILSNNETYSKNFTFFGNSLFDIADWSVSNILLVLSGLFGSLFIGYFVPKSKVRGWTNSFFKSNLSFSIWYYIIKILAPLMVLIIFYDKVIKPTYNLFFPI